MADELDVNEVIAEMRGIIGEQGQQIAMLRAALNKTTRPPEPATDTPPVPTPTD